MPFAEIAALGRRDPRIFAQPKWLRDRVAVVVELTMDNLFHSFFHLLPLREDLYALRQSLETDLRSGRRSRLDGDAMGAAGTGAVSARNGSATDATESSCCQGVDLLPRYTVLWPALSSDCV